MGLSIKAVRKVALQLDFLQLSCGMLKHGDDVRERLPNLHDNLISCGATRKQADEFIDDVQDVLDDY
ncbi:hypothetical protein ACWIEX_06035 [Bosea sp. NPDC055353]